MRAEGFILQASYRIDGGAPVVHLYGRFTDGRTFLVKDRRQTPCFFIDATDEDRARKLGANRVWPSEIVTFDGEPTSRVEVGIPSDAPALRDRLHDAAIPTFEADVRFAVRYLIDRDIRGGCIVDGDPIELDTHSGEDTSREDVHLDCVFEDAEVMAADVEFRASVLSFDIETDPDAERLLAVSLYMDRSMGSPDQGVVDEVVIVDPEGRDMPAKAIGVASEREALEWFVDRIHTLNPDVLTGWNVIDFDLTVLAKIAKRARHPFEIGRDVGGLRIRPAVGYFGSGQATVPGRLVLDGMDLVRGAFIRLDDYSLDAVARKVLGEGKALEGDVHDRAGEILDRYLNDLEGFAGYARTDARLVSDIVDRLNLMALAVARSRLTGMTLDRVSASIASFDFVYLAALAKRGICAPSVRSGDSRVFAAQAGGHVLEPATGMHDNVWIFDYKSLYPSVMRTFNIDPLGFVGSDMQIDDDLIETPVGARFRRGPAILPEVLDQLFAEREAAKAHDDGVASQAIKILMNSFYGVLGTPACRFHNPEIANAITGLGRHFLLWSKSWFEDAGYEVLYGDTDSVFIRSGIDDAAAARAQGAAIGERMNVELAEYITQTWRVDSRLELEFEKLYLKLFLPSARHSTTGARKRYAGLVDGADEVEFVGMEVVRRDWTDLAKDVQRGLYDRLFNGHPVEPFLEDCVKRVRAGELDDKLVYRKGVRKDLDSYTSTTPPHVVAARKSSDPGRVIAYMITVAGPEPLDNLDHGPDREHYVQKQIRPVSEPVLDALGLEFDRTVGDDRQLGLF